MLFPGVLTDLHDLVVAAEKRLRPGLPEAEEEEETRQGNDPMDEMEDDVEPQPRKQSKSKFVKQVSTFVMNEWPPETITGNGILEKKVVVYLEGTGKLWINKVDINWLVRTLYIQQQLKGVGIVASDDEGPDSIAIVTPEKRPKPQECEGHLHDKWDTPP